MGYLLAYLLLFFLPGWFLVQLLQVRKFAFLLALAFSYALLALMLLLLICWRAPIWLFDGLVALAVALAAGGLAVGYWRRWAAAQRGTAGWGRRCRVRLPVYGVAGAIIAGVFAYLGYAGPYTEIPADVWAHLARLQEGVSVIRSGYFSCSAPAWQMTMHQSNYWYLILGWMCQRFGFGLPGLLWSVTLANVVTFLLGYYFLSLYVFRRARLPRAAKCGMAGVAALFAALTLGVNVFAYIRYYALAPAILNQVLYAAAVVLFMEYLRRPAWITPELWLIPLLLYAALLIHSQETVFAVFMMLGIVLCEAWRAWRGNSAPSLVALRAKTAVFLAGAAGLYCGLALLLPPSPFRAVPEYFLISLERIAPFLKAARILPPGGQFYEVVGWWGCFVYLLFFLRLRDFSRYAYILAGMLLPLLTVFNPLTVDLLMRLGIAPTVQYRFALALPLPMVAGCLLVNAVGGLFRTGSRQRIRPANEPAGRPRSWHAGIWCWAFAILLGAGLIGFLFPIHTRDCATPFSRLNTLRRISPANDYRLWGDLLAFLEPLRDWRIITDRVTGYIISGGTGNSTHVAWLRNSAFDWWLLADRRAGQPDGLFEQLNRDWNWLLVINERDGDFSVNGAISRHWPGDILKVSRFYAPAMQAYVADHPERFRLIWNRDRIRVYEINPK